jgi:hypothetical protein
MAVEEAAESWVAAGRVGGAVAEAAAAAAPQARGLHAGAQAPPRRRGARGQLPRVRGRAMEPLQPPARAVPYSPL